MVRAGAQKAARRAQVCERRSAFAKREADERPPHSLILFLPGAALAALLPLPFLLHQFGLAMPAPWWHPHEAVFGFGAALCGGFLLTALPNWLGLDRPGRVAVWTMIAIWAGGRMLAFLAATGFAQGLALGSSVFPAILAIHAFAVTHRSARKRPRKIAWFVTAYAAAALILDIGIVLDISLSLPMRIAEACLVLLLLTMLSRMLPAFSAQVLEEMGKQAGLKTFDAIDAAGLGASAVCLAGWCLFDGGLPVSISASLAAALNTIRLLRWRGWQAGWQPLLSPLHLAHGFIVLGFALLAYHAVSPGTDWTAAAATHAFLAGGMAVASLAVVGRLLVGHMGEVARRPLSLAVMLVTGATLFRIGSGALPASQHLILGGSALLWFAGFSVFALRVLVPPIRGMLQAP